MDADLVTRKDYMLANNAGDRVSQQEAHRRYYAQFVTPETIAYLQRAYSAAELARAFHEDEHFNSIPIGTWDALTWQNFGGGTRWSTGGMFRSIIPFDREKARAAGESITRAVLVCIAKSAAQQIVETR